MTSPMLCAIRQIFWDYVDKRLKSGSANGGIMYGRVRPAKRGRHRTPPRVLVIAIRKRAKGGNGARLQGYASHAGLTPTGSPVDVFAADMHQVSQGYSALDSLSAIRDSTIPVDYVSGSHTTERGIWDDEEIS